MGTRLVRVAGLCLWVAWGGLSGHALGACWDSYFFILDERSAPHVVGARLWWEPPIVGACVGAVAFGLLWAAAGRRTRHSLSDEPRTSFGIALAPLGLLMLAILPYWSSSVDHVPLLFLWGTGLLSALWIVVLTIVWGLWPSAIGGLRPSLTRLRRLWYWMLAKRGKRLAGLLVVVAIAVTPAWVESVICGGDEPHYLLITHSIVEDGDLDLEDDYGSLVSRRWTPLPLKMHVVRRGKHGEAFSVHSVGLPLLILPGFYVGGQIAGGFGERVGAVMTQHALTFLALLSLFRLARRFTRSKTIAGLTVVGLALSLPWSLYAFSIYTELPAAALTLWSLERLTSPHRSDLTALQIAVVLWLLPWFHVKYLVLAVGLSLWLIVDCYRRSSVGVAAVIAAFVALISQGVPLFHYGLYADYSFFANYGAGYRPDLLNMPLWMMGQLVDRRFGLFVYAPVAAVGAIGLVMWLKTRRFIALGVAVLVGGHWAAVSTARYWSGGGPYPNRLMLPVLPLVVLGFAIYVASARREASARHFGIGRYRLPLAIGYGALALSILMTAWAVLAPHRAHQRTVGISSYFMSLASGGVSLGEFLPTFAPIGETTVAHLGLLVLAVAAMAGSCLAFRGLWRRVPERSPWSVAAVTGFGLWCVLIMAGYGTGVEELRQGRWYQEHVWARSASGDPRRYARLRRSSRFDLWMVWPADREDLPNPQIRMEPSYLVRGGRRGVDRGVNDTPALLVEADDRAVFPFRERLEAGRWRLLVRLRTQDRTGTARVQVFEPESESLLSELSLPARGLHDRYRTVSAPFELVDVARALDIRVRTVGESPAPVWVEWVALVPVL